MTGSLAVEMHDATAADSDGIVGRDHLETLRTLQLAHGPSPRSGVGNSQCHQARRPPASTRSPMEGDTEATLIRSRTLAREYRRPPLAVSNLHSRFKNGV